MNEAPREVGSLFDTEPARPAQRPGALRRVWLQIYHRIDRVVAIEGDTDTRRLQKALVVVASLVGSAATLFNALALFGAGLSGSAWVYVGSAFVLLCGGLSMLRWPGRYVAITWALLLDVLIAAAFAQVLSGGLTSGLLAIPWTVFAPLGAALALEVRHKPIHLALFVFVIFAVALADPWARTIGIQAEAQALVAFNVPSLVSLGLMSGAMSIYLLRQMESFRATADSLLLYVLPAPIANRLKRAERTIADRYDGVTVLFADIVGFTPLASELDAEAIVRMLNTVFSEFDDLAAQHGILKIKTIGDSYMAAAGLPEPMRDHTKAVVDFGLAMLEIVDRHQGLDGRPMRLRVGVHTGPVVAGVIGHDRFTYDMWGDTVNVASRMESTGLTDRVQVSEAVVAAVGDQFTFERRPPMEIKGKGLTTTYLVTSREPASFS